MKFYLKLTSILSVCVVGCLLISLLTSCQVFKKNSDLITIVEASYYKTFGGQGRSRNINFELKTKESLALIDAIYWLEVDGFKVDLKIHQKGEESKLLGYYTEYRASREVDFDDNSLFDKIPFENTVLKVKQSEKTESIRINKLENKPAKYYP